MQSVALIQWCLDNLNYWTVTLLMTIESSFIPFPSEVVITPAAYKAAITGEMNIFLVIFFATLGADLGALANYYLARYLGRPIIYKFANSRIGHMCLIDAEKVEKAEKYFEARGSVSTFIGRLIPGIRQLVSIPAGLAKMKLLPFLLYTTIGAGIWNIILAALGYFIPIMVPAIDSEEKLIEQVTEYSHLIGYAIFACVFLIVGVLIYKGTKKTAAEVSAE